MVGVSARRRASRAIGVQASNRDAPKARYISTLSRLSLEVSVRPLENKAHARKGTCYISFRTYATATTMPETVLPQSMPTIGTYQRSRGQPSHWNRVGGRLISHYIVVASKMALPPLHISYRLWKLGLSSPTLIEGLR